jgi:hypothetical protein
MSGGPTVSPPGKAAMGPFPVLDKYALPTAAGAP